MMLVIIITQVGIESQHSKADNDIFLYLLYISGLTTSHLATGIVQNNQKVLKVEDINLGNLVNA